MAFPFSHHLYMSFTRLQQAHVSLPAKENRQTMSRTLAFIAMMICLFLATPALGQPSSPAAVAPAPPADATGVEELMNILVAKGLLKKEDVETAMQKKEGQAVSPIAVLTGLLKEKGVLTADEAERVAKKSGPAAARPVVILSQRDRKDFEQMARDATLEIQNDIKQQVKTEVLQETQKKIDSAAAPEWTKRIRFGGDIRLRYQGDYFDKNNFLVPDPNNPSQLLDTTNDRNRFLVRARLGATMDIDDKTEAGVRLMTGSTTNPVSTNATLGNYMNKYGATLDLAYIKVKPVPGLTLIGGRISNPFFFSELVWYKDLTFDGAAATYRRPLFPMLEGFITGGVFPLQQIDSSGAHDKWLYGTQVGFDWKPRKEIFAKLGLAYYYYQNTTGMVNNPNLPIGTTDWSAPAFIQKGNTLFDIEPASTMKLALASNYRELNPLAMLDLGFWDPIHVVLLGDYVNNIGFNKAQVARLVGPLVPVRPQTQGYQVGLSVGHPQINNFGQWRAFSYYRYIQADAVLDAFTDPDFHLGGTNAKGWIVGFDLGLRKNLWLSAKWVSTNEISGYPLAIDSLFVDVNVRF